MDDGQLINRAAFNQARSELGSGFVRILGYFQEDGVKCVAAIEEAMRNHNATALVIPSHTLKGDSRQFGAEFLGDLAETIEVIARKCVETRDTPDEALEHVVQLRPTFDRTLAVLEREANPLVERRPMAPMGFGKRPASFGNR